VSNFPPGVTGAEYEIAGADVEIETEALCTRCVVEGDCKEGEKVGAMVYGFHGELWAQCDNGHDVELDDCDDAPDEPDFEAIAEARAEARAEAAADRYDRECLPW